jgi:hypothetical protein
MEYYNYSWAILALLLLFDVALAKSMGGQVNGSLVAAISISLTHDFLPATASSIELSRWESCEIMSYISEQIFD